MVLGMAAAATHADGSGGSSKPVHGCPQLQHVRGFYCRAGSKAPIRVRRRCQGGGGEHTAERGAHFDDVDDAVDIDGVRQAVPDDRSEDVPEPVRTDILTRISGLVLTMGMPP